MRITNITISRWRNFRDITIDIPEDLKLICLASENGGGKSNLLELISSCCELLGIARGSAFSRTNFRHEVHDIKITFKTGSELDGFHEKGKDSMSFLKQSFIKANINNWDKTLTLESKKKEEDNNPTIQKIAGGISGRENQEEFVQQVSSYLVNCNYNYFFCLDSERAYRLNKIDAAQLFQALHRNWDNKENKRSLPANQLFTEWMGYLFARDITEANRHTQNMRDARRNKTTEPIYAEPFVSYNQTLQKVLPYLKFIGIDVVGQRILFDSTGVTIDFSQLSSGEKEIAFLIGQFERFKLSQGLLLIDEPELHMNPDLVRIWVKFLRDMVEDGQVWMATHSLEVVEVAGDNATRILVKSTKTRLVDSTIDLDCFPALAMLSSALGAPAFSITELRFIFIEGETHSDAIKWFEDICVDSKTTRFIPIGNCEKVSDTVETLKEGVKEIIDQIHIGGIIDRDFKISSECEQLVRNSTLYVMECHEIENLFLYPETLQKLCSFLGKGNFNVQNLIREASDKFAGAWIQQKAFYEANISNSDKKLKADFWGKSWETLSNSNNGEKVIDEILRSSSATNYERLREPLKKALNDYAAVRTNNDLWKSCMGKQVLSEITAKLGLVNQKMTITKFAIQCWVENNGSGAPEEVKNLQKFVQSI